MGFFGDRPWHVASESGPEAVPFWPSGRRYGTLPGMVATRAVIFRSNQLICYASRFEVYPDGVAFTLQAHLRDDVEDQFEEIPWDLNRGSRRAHDGFPDDFMWFGILDGVDGSSWSNIDGPPTRGSAPRGPVVTMGSGSGLTL